MPGCTFSLQWLLPRAGLQVLPALSFAQAQPCTTARAAHSKASSSACHSPCNEHHARAAGSSASASENSLGANRARASARADESDLEQLFLLRCQISPQIR